MSQYQPNGNQYYQPPNPNQSQFNQQPNQQFNYNDYSASFKQMGHQQQQSQPPKQSPQKQQPNFQPPPQSNSYINEQHQPIVPDQQHYGALDKNFENLSLNNSKEIHSPSEINQSPNNSNIRKDSLPAQDSPASFYQQPKLNQSFEYDQMKNLNGTQQPPNHVMPNRYPPDPSLSNSKMQKVGKFFFFFFAFLNQ